MLLGRAIIFAVTAVLVLADVRQARADTDDEAMALAHGLADPGRGPHDCPSDGVGSMAIRGVAEAPPGSRTGALFRSLLVPGYGQLYNEQPVKGGVLFGAELALLSTALAFHVAGDSVFGAYSREARAQVNSDPTGRVRQLYDSAQTRYRIRDGLLISATALWVLNLADAYLSGGRVRPPPESGGARPASDCCLAPIAAIRPGQAILGLQGRF